MLLKKKKKKWISHKKNGKEGDRLMRNLFKFRLKRNHFEQPGQLQPLPASPDPNQALQQQQTAPPAPLVPVPVKPEPRPYLATDLTLDYLKKVELDDILELMYPRLVTDQQTRLEGCTSELEEIDRELTKLHLMRDDVLNAHPERLVSGVANF